MTNSRPPPPGTLQGMLLSGKSSNAGHRVHTEATPTRPTVSLVGTNALHTEQHPFGGECDRLGQYSVAGSKRLRSRMRTTLFNQGPQEYLGSRHRPSYRTRIWWDRYRYIDIGIGIGIGRSKTMSTNACQNFEGGYTLIDNAAWKDSVITEAGPCSDPDVCTPLTKPCIEMTGYQGRQQILRMRTGESRIVVGRAWLG